MNASEFKKLVNKHFSPNILELGWKGSGFHFYQPNPNHVVNIFGLQGSWFGGSVCCETAIHFDFLRGPDHKEIDITKKTYASCLIRERRSPKGEGDWHWRFSDKEENNLNSINQIWEAFRIYGLKFYNDFANFPYPFDNIKPGDLRISTNYKILNKYHVPNQIELTWLLKEINLFIGRKEIAKDFCELGMAKAIKFTQGRSKQATESYLAEYKDRFKI
jgi:hypothetical protein